MKTEGNRVARGRVHTLLAVIIRTLARRPLLSPTASWALRAFKAKAAGTVISWILLGVAVVGQLVLLGMTAYLMDLSVSLMGLWAELARKHLELTL
jgi:hypothetical protein